MTDLIIRPKSPPTCGGCHFAQPIPDNLLIIQCNGLPPTPCIVGGQQTVSGPQFQVELMRPRLARSERACALWREKTPDFADQH